MKYKSSHKGNMPDHKHYKAEGKEVSGEFTDWPMDQSMNAPMGKMPRLNQDEMMTKEANIDKHPVFFTKE